MVAAEGFVSRNQDAHRIAQPASDQHWKDFERWRREVEELSPKLTRKERGAATRVAYAMLPEKYVESSAHEYVFAAYCCSLLLRSGDCSSDVLTHLDRLRAVYGTTKTDLVKKDISSTYFHLLHECGDAIASSLADEVNCGKFSHLSFLSEHKVLWANTLKALKRLPNGIAQVLEGLTRASGESVQEFTNFLVQKFAKEIANEIAGEVSNGGLKNLRFVGRRLDSLSESPFSRA